MDAPGILGCATDCIGDRAAERDQDDERSMAKTVAAFNALTGASLTETQGWAFMAVLKLARASQGRLQMDDYIDGAAYVALAGESASRGSS